VFLIATLKRSHHRVLFCWYSAVLCDYRLHFQERKQANINITSVEVLIPFFFDSATSGALGVRVDPGQASPFLAVHHFRWTSSKDLDLDYVEKMVVIVPFNKSKCLQNISVSKYKYRRRSQPPSCAISTLTSLYGHYATTNFRNRCKTVVTCKIKHLQNIWKMF